MNRIFEIDYKKWVELLLPIRLRKAAMIAWLYVLIIPINNLYKLFLGNRKANLYRLKITSQVAYLERLLNDRYDTELRDIYISDGSFNDPLYIYQKSEQKLKGLYLRSEEKPLILYRSGETMQKSVDFFIHIPSDINFSEDELRSMVDIYKLAGKTYLIQTFNR